MGNARFVAALVKARRTGPAPVDPLPHCRQRRPARWAWGLLLAVAVAASGRARAETDPRDYEALVALPSRTAASIVYYRHVSASGTQDFTQDIGILRSAYILRFGKLSIVPFDVVLPVADATAFTPVMPGSPANLALHAAGIGDFEFLPTIGLLFPEGPINHTYIAFTPYFTFPTGQYNPSHPVNIGANRYSFQEELAIGQRLFKIVNLEGVINVTEYTDNPNFAVEAMGMALSGHLTHQLSYGGVVHASVDVSQHIYLAVSYYGTVLGEQHFTNGALNIDMKAIDRQVIHTLRFGAGIRVEPQTLLLVQYSQDIAASGGAPISRFIGARISHAW